jgi:hypothetical protein
MGLGGRRRSPGAAAGAGRIGGLHGGGQRNHVHQLEVIGETLD